MTVAEYGLVALAVATILRTEHLIASDFWILLKGENWVQQVSRLSYTELRDPKKVWHTYRDNGGGKLPYLFFGIKSYRLYAWYKDPLQSRPVKLLAMAVRGAWRYYAYVPASVFALAVASTSNDWSNQTQIAMLISAFMLIAGMIAIAAEGVLSAYVLDSWAILYHRWPNAADLRKRNPLREISLFAGVLILTVSATVTVNLVAGARFRGFVGFPQVDIVRQIEQAAILSVPFVGWIQAANGTGFLAGTCIILAWAAQAIFFVISLTRLWIHNSLPPWPSYPSGMPPSSPAAPGHAFISYTREDSAEVDWLQGLLEAGGIQVWRDTRDLWPGQDWRIEIRRAITSGSLAFIACFSPDGAARQRSYQREELALAVDEMRERIPGDPWIFPVRFGDCALPYYDLGGGRTLDSLQRVDLFGGNKGRNASRLVDGVRRLLSTHGGTS